MSQQQILKINQENLYNDFREQLISEGDNMFLNDKFKVDCLGDKKKYLWLLAYYNILKIPSCEVSEMIKRERGYECHRKNKPKKKDHTKECKPHAVCQITSNLGKTDW